MWLSLQWNVWSLFDTNIIFYFEAFWMMLSIFVSPGTYKLTETNPKIKSVVSDLGTGGRDSQSTVPRPQKHSLQQSSGVE